MSARHHHALLAALAKPAPAPGIRYGQEDFSTYPNAVSPDAPLNQPRWTDGGLGGAAVEAGVLVVRAKHSATGGFRYAEAATTGGKYVRVLLDWYPGITDEERRIFIETNGRLGSSTGISMFYFAANSVQVAVSSYENSVQISTSELIGRPNAQLAISDTQPTWLEVFVPATSAGTIEARTWGQSQPRPSQPGYSVAVATVQNQFGPLSLDGQLVLRSINNDTARIRKIAILSTP